MTAFGGGKSGGEGVKFSVGSWRSLYVASASAGHLGLPEGADLPAALSVSQSNVVPPSFRLPPPLPPPGLLLLSRSLDETGDRLLSLGVIVLSLSLSPSLCLKTDENLLLRRLCLRPRRRRRPKAGVTRLSSITRLECSSFFEGK